MKVDIMIHGMAKKRGKLLLLIHHEEMDEPKHVSAASLKAADDKGELIYNSTRPIPRKVSMTKRMAQKLGIA